MHESVIVPCCSACREHWAETEKWQTGSTDVEMKIFGSVGAGVAFAFIWGKLAFWPAIATIVVLGVILFLVNFARSPKSKPGHASGTTVPATAGFADGQLSINFENGEFVRRFLGENVTATSPPPPFKVYSWGSLLAGLATFALFAAWTAYVCRDGFSWWSIATGWGACAGLVRMFAALAPDPSPNNLGDNSPPPSPPSTSPKG